jgi:S1-C subfamily serine protease
VNPLDVIAVLLLVAAVAAGLRTGALPQIGGIAGAVTGFLVAIALMPILIDAVSGLAPLPRALLVLGVILGLVGLGEALGSGFGRMAAGGLGRGALDAVHRAGGAIVGAAQATLVIWLAGGLLAAGPIPALSAAANSSVAVRTVSGWLPPPTEFVDEIASALDASGLPEVFVGLEPVPLDPVDRPSDPIARAIAALAQASTGRVSAVACGTNLTGSGFAIAPDYLVTAAHVVAGASAVRVASPSGGTRDAVVVRFDPALDLAVLHVPGLGAPALRFASDDPGRGDVGAALGYPGGGPLVITPAAVAGRYAATGRDIYGRDRVIREILELRAEVNRGDSGGAFVLRDGTVGGVVFAESRVDPEVGYAIAASDAAPVAEGAVGRTAAVGTGDCLR